MSRSTRTVLVVLAALVVAVGGYLLVRPKDDAPSTSAATTTPATTTPTGTTSKTTAAPAAETTRITIKDGAPVGGVAKIDVRKGDTVRLVVATDAAGEIHVHGFDLEQEAAPGKPARFRFTADIEGRFEVEAHATDSQIAEITVNP